MNRGLVMGELEGRLPKLVGESVGTLLLRLLGEDPSKRPTASEVLSVLTTPPVMTTTTMTMMMLLAFADFGGEERRRPLLVAVGSGVEEVRVAAEEAFAEDGLGRVRRVEVFSSDFDLFVDADSKTVFQDKGRVKVFPEHIEGFLGMIGKMQVVVKHDELQLLDKLEERPPFLVIDFTGASLIDVHKRYVPIVMGFEHVVLKGVRGNIADEFLTESGSQNEDRTSCRLRSLRFSLGSLPTVIGDFFLDGCTSLQAVDPSLLSNITSIDDSFLGECTSLQAVDLSPLSNVASIGNWFSLQAVDLSPLSNITSIDSCFLDECTSLQAIKANKSLRLPVELEKIRQ